MQVLDNMKRVHLFDFLLSHKLRDCVLFSTILISFLSISQNESNKSVDLDWSNHKLNSDERIERLIETIEKNYIGIKNDSALILAKKGYEFSLKVNSTKGKIRFLNIRGAVFRQMVNYGRAHICFTKALNLAKIIKSREDIADSYANLGNLYLIQDNYSESLKHYQRSLEVYQTLKMEKKTISVYGGIGSIYFGLKELDKALFYSTKALELAKKYNERSEIAIHLNNVGNVYSAKGDHSKTLEYHLRSEKILKEVGDVSNRIIILGNIGSDYYYLGDNHQAIHYFDLSLSLAESKNDDRGLAVILNQLGQFYFDNEDYNLSKKYLTQLEIVSRRSNLDLRLQRACLLLSKIYEIQGDYKKAHQYYKENVDLSDQIQGKEDFQTALQFEIRLEYEKQIAFDSIENQKRLELKELQITKKNTELEIKKSQQNVLYVGLLLLFFFGGFLYYKFRNVRSHKLLLEVQKKEESSKRLLVENELRLAILESQLAFFKGQEEEKQKIAQNLHDNLGTSLTFLRIELERVLKNRPDVSLSMVQNELEKVSKELRGVSHDLYPISLKDGGLISGIKELLFRVDDSIKVHFSYQDIPEMSDEKKLQLYRVLQELLKNTMTHSNADNIYVQLDLDSSLFSILYEDDGQGVDMSKIEYGIGLKNISSRCNSISANCTFESAIGNGFSAIIQLSVHQIDLS